MFRGYYENGSLDILHSIGNCKLKNEATHNFSNIQMLRLFRMATLYFIHIIALNAPLEMREELIFSSIQHIWNIGRNATPNT